MQDQLRKPGIGERLSQLTYLLKHTFTIVGRDPGIIRPWVRMAIYSIVMSSLFFLGALFLGLGRIPTGSILLTISVLLFFYKFFYFARQEMRQSWLVSEALKGNRRSVDEAGVRVGELASTCRRIALLDMLVSWIVAMARRNQQAGSLMRVVVKGLEEVWDLLNHYLLPSAAVDGYGIREGVGRMKTLRDNVPGTLAGVFGIDIAAKAVGTIIGPLYFGLILLAAGAGVWLGDALPAFHVGDIRQMLDDPQLNFLPETLNFSWLPLLLALWLGKSVSVVLERVTTTVKVIYFSIFYMRITHADEIIPEIRGELDGYLRMEKDDVAPVASPA